MPDSSPRFAAVAVNVPVRTIYTYSIPAELSVVIQPGCRVSLRFGHQEVRGYVLELTDTAPEGLKLRDIGPPLDPLPLLNPAILELGRWISDYYLCPLGETLDAMLPPPAKEARPVELYRVIQPEENWSLPARLRRPRELARLIAAAPGGLERTQITQTGSGAIRHLRTLLDHGIVERSTFARVARSDQNLPPVVEFPPLTPDQESCYRAVVADLDAQRHQVHVVHGITGAGKTEVYLNLIRHCRASGRGAIFLLPEIALTIPMISILRKRFGGDVALLHSAMSTSERYREWLAIARGERSIVVGARSAVFAPLARPGLFVIDEEPETSYKQEDRPCYHARDVARERARAHGAVLVLGSATPSLETYVEGRSNPTSYHRLLRRFNGLPLPEVRLLNMGEEFAKKKNRSIFSMVLKAEMQRVLDSGGQALLFLNRRGHSTYVFCRACGKAVECRDCAVTLTYHMASGRMLCHLCGYSDRPPRACPECQDPAIRYCGGGTQKVEEEFKANFPDVVADRMDSDTTSRRGSHETILEAYRTGHTRVLIGTQMVAKGFDFPNLDLVGVINADAVLHMSDFRSAERTFQTVTQVAGRVGRGTRAGLVLVQTYSPEHYALQCAQLHDFEAFAAQELPQREALGYPPYGRLILVTADAEDEAKPRDALSALRRSLDTEASRLARVRLMGPAPARVPKIQNRFRFSLLIKLPMDLAAGKPTREQLLAFTPPGGLGWRVDVDPMFS